jgi:hypothetical protein
MSPFHNTGYTQNHENEYVEQSGNTQEAFPEIVSQNPYQSCYYIPEPSCGQSMYMFPQCGFVGPTATLIYAHFCLKKESEPPSP